MNLIEKVEALEDSIIEIQKDLMDKKRELRRLLDGAYSPCAKSIKPIERTFSREFIEAINELICFINVDNNGICCDFIKVEEFYIYVKIDEFYMNLSKDIYPSKNFIKDLRKNGIVEGNSHEYYKSVRIKGKSCKCIKMKKNIIFNLLENREIEKL